ncbi:hypothetical protein Val02_84030 [Virgisporangium aliadipatigenens]|uniref:Uncharacterized protein n=1 Tax=Virgisporangium aliadipatigenens TaxID=741659 RepID=A0A8J3YW05_9ACTN|nr:DUF6232 family protein [Virgisporangium aliadipatigenens]GIJ51517.1 hypothetical protein Val02_84030 [Virgisporangium aliadipatigenens]
MTQTFYNHRGLRITDQWVSVDGRRYPLAATSGFHTTTDPVSRVGIGTLLAGGAVLFMAVALSPVMALPTAIGLAVVGGAITFVGAVVTRFSPRLRHLWLGNAVVLSTTDSTELGKAARALRRAREHRYLMAA